MSNEIASEEVVQMEDDDDVEEDEEDEEEVEDEEEDVEEDDDDETLEEITVGRRSGRGLTLKTLLKARVLQPGQGLMNINYLVRDLQFSGMT